MRVKRKLQRRSTGRQEALAVSSPPAWSGVRHAAGSGLLLSLALERSSRLLHVLNEGIRRKRYRVSNAAFSNSGWKPWEGSLAEATRALVDRSACLSSFSIPHCILGRVLILAQLYTQTCHQADYRMCISNCVWSGALRSSSSVAAGNATWRLRCADAAAWARRCYPLDDPGRR